MKLLAKTPLALAVALAGSVSLLQGCGESSSPDSGDPVNLVSRGMITGFGSVYVNRERFDTDGASISVDDESGDETDLRVGMIVTVHGTSDDDGEHWRASSVDYDNELKGPVSAIAAGASVDQKLLTILGQTVVLNLDTTIDDDLGLSFDSIEVGDVVEVSGYQSAAGLVATHIEAQDNDDEIEIKGRIDNLLAASFTIGGFDVIFDGATELEDIASLASGLYVEVEGHLDGAGTTLIAEKIQAEDDGIDEDADEAELAGVVYDYDASEQTFRMQNLLVDASSAELSPASLVIANDMTVKVEGYMQNGVLVADEIEKKGKKVKLSATLSVVTVDSVSFSFSDGDITARINAGTELDDDTGNPVIQLSDFSSGDFVELEAWDDGIGALNVVELERKDADEVEIEAAVEAFDESALTVDLLGVTFNLAAASFEDEESASIDAMAFFDGLEVGRFIEIKDGDANGVFEEAELDD